jgi:aldehyde:ferredoxin oxidoreductase
MPNSYYGRCLHINLSNGQSWVEPLERASFLSLIGGRGINARLAWEGIPPETNPLGPENLLIFAPGLLTGTGAPLTGRSTVTCLSPATGHYLKTNVGGHIGAAIKAAGYDQVVVHGRAERWVTLRIHNDEVGLFDASALRGLDTRQTTLRIQVEFGGQDIKVACIGPAGENQVMYASIMVDIYSAAGRGGAGAVMGSKNLKALAVSGDHAVGVAMPEDFFLWNQRARAAMVAASSPHVLYEYGTASGISGVNEMHANTGKNFQVGYLPGCEQLDGVPLVENGYIQNREACFSCMTGCKRHSEARHTHYGGIQSGGPEYESVAALGFGPAVTDVVAVLKANELCNLMGLDTISTGSCISWLLESKEKGVLPPELDGDLDLTWGNPDTLLSLVPKIALRQGVGDLLAMGVRRAARSIGGGSQAWAVESKGLEQSRVDTRSSKAYALAFAVNLRGPDHLFAQPIAELGENELAVRLIEKLTGDRKLANPYTTEKRPEIVVWHEDVYAAVDALGFCSFPTLADYAIDPEMMAGFFSAAVGEPICEAELLKAGRRIYTLEKCFNVRLGFDRRDDRLPDRMMYEENADRPGEDNNPGELDAMLDGYYQLRGWDLRTSWPTRGELSRLGLGDLADQLTAYGKQLPEEEALA